VEEDPQEEIMTVVGEDPPGRGLILVRGLLLVVAVLILAPVLDPHLLRNHPLLAKQRSVLLRALKQTHYLLAREVVLPRTIAVVPRDTATRD